MGDAGTSEKTDPEGSSPTPVVYVKITEAQIREIEESKQQCEESKKTRGTAHPITLEQLVKLGDLYYSTYQWLEAEACFRQAWGGFSRAHGFHVYKPGEGNGEEEIKVEEKVDDEKDTRGKHLSSVYMSRSDNRRVYHVQTKLALALQQARRYAEAFFHFKDALTGIEGIFGTESESTLICIDGLGQTAYVLEDFLTSEGYFERLLNWYRSHFGPQDGRTLYAITKLAIVYKDRNRLADAERLSRGSLDDCIRILGLDHPTTQGCASILAFIKHLQGDSLEALAGYQYALKCYERSLGPLHDDSISVMCKIARLLHDLRRFRDAELMHRRSYEGFCLTIGETHPKALEECHQIAILLWKQEKLEEAEVFAEKTIAGKIEFYGDTHPSTLDAYLTLARIIQAQSHWRHRSVSAQRLMAAVDIYDKVVENRKSVLGNSSVETLESALLFASFLYISAQKGNNDSHVNTEFLKKAEELFEFVFINAYEKYGPFHNFFSEASYYLSAIRLRQDSFEASAEMALLCFMSFLCFYFNNLLKKFMASTHSIDQSMVPIVNATFREIISQLPPSLSCPIHRLELINNRNGAIVEHEKLGYKPEFERNKSRGGSRPRLDLANSSQLASSSSGKEFESTIGGSEMYDADRPIGKGDFNGLYNLNISILEEYMYMMTENRNAADADLHFNPKEQAIKRMFIHTTDSDANINTSKYSTLKHSFQSANQSTASFEASKTNNSMNSTTYSPQKTMESTTDIFNQTSEEISMGQSFNDTQFSSSQKTSTISLNQSRIDRLEASFTVKVSEFYQSLQPLDYQVLTNPSPPLRSIRDKMRVRSYGKTFQKIRTSKSACSSIQEPCCEDWAKWVEEAIIQVEAFIDKYGSSTESDRLACILDGSGTVFSDNRPVPSSLVDLQAVLANAASRFLK